VSRLVCGRQGCQGLPRWVDVIIVLRERGESIRHRATVLCDKHAEEKSSHATQRQRYNTLIRRLTGPGKPPKADDLIFSVEAWG
jgi:hypothetical protein